MTLADAYRKTPADATEARGMLDLIREHNRQGLRGDPVMNTTNARIAFLKGYLAANTEPGT